MDRFIDGFSDELVKLGSHGALGSFLNSPGGAMFAAHVPLGGAILGAGRSHRGSRTGAAMKGMAAEIAGNIVGAGLGLGAAKVLEHTLLRGAHVPAWFEPALIAGGGLGAAPLAMHLITKGH